MKSKISCFNKTIFKKNLTLYWPLWTAWLLLLLAMVPVNLYQYMRLHMANPLARQFSALRSVFEIASEPLLIFTFCVFAVMCVFLTKLYWPLSYFILYSKANLPVTPGIS